MTKNWIPHLLTNYAAGTTETSGMYEQVDTRYTAEARASNVLEETTYHAGSRYQVGMLWTQIGSSLPNNYFSALVQLKSLERRSNKDPKLKQYYGKTIQDDLDKGLRKSTNQTASKLITTESGIGRTTHLSTPQKRGRVRRVSNGAATFQGQPLNNVLLTGPDWLQSLIQILMCFR